MPSVVREWTKPKPKDEYQARQYASEAVDFAVKVIAKEPELLHTTKCQKAGMGMMLGGGYVPALQDFSGKHQQWEESILACGATPGNGLVALSLTVDAECLRKLATEHSKRRNCDGLSDCFDLLATVA